MENKILRQSIRSHPRRNRVKEAASGSATGVGVLLKACRMLNRDKIGVFVFPWSRVLCEKAMCFRVLLRFEVFHFLEFLFGGKRHGLGLLRWVSSLSRLLSYNIASPMPKPNPAKFSALRFQGLRRLVPVRQNGGHNVTPSLSGNYCAKFQIIGV